MYFFMNKFLSSFISLFCYIPENERKITIATLFTIVRILLTPCIIYLMIMQWWLSAFLLFIFTASTDIIDGFLARYLNEKTFLGACLDPIADKIFLFSTFFTLYLIDTSVFHIPLWFICFLLSKELLQIIGALLLYKYCGWVALEANIWGKITTFIQIMFIVWLFNVHFSYMIFDITIYNSFLLIICLLMIISFVQYSFIW